MLKNKLITWNPQFYRNFPGFSSLLPVWQQWENRQENWPTVADYNRYRSPQAKALEFIRQIPGINYEKSIYFDLFIPTREGNWHDFFNNLTWLQFEKTKWTLVERSVQENAKIKQAPRNHLQNQLAHFDECGMVICANREDLLIKIRAHQWREFFTDPELTQNCEAFILGHGLYEKALNPFIGMTGKAILLFVEKDFLKGNSQDKINIIDTEIAKQISQSKQLVLQPFPLLGWPGWFKDNTNSDFFSNQYYFRPQAKRQ